MNPSEPTRPYCASSSAPPGAHAFFPPLQIRLVPRSTIQQIRAVAMEKRWLEKAAFDELFTQTTGVLEEKCVETE